LVAASFFDFFSFLVGFFDAIWFLLSSELPPGAVSFLYANDAPISRKINGGRKARVLKRMEENESL